MVALLFASPAMASSFGISSAQNSGPQRTQATLQKADLQLGQTFTLTSVAGSYIEIGNPTVNGTATGSLNVKVTGVFTAGYSVSVTGGQLSVNGVTYTMSGGSGEVGSYGAHMVGQAQAGTSAQMLFATKDLGKFGTTSYGVLRIDLTNGTNGFAVKLLVTISAT